MIYYLIFFFSSRRRHTRYIGDWSSDVCSSDLMEDSFARMDGAKLSSIQVAITKAESAAIRRMATGPAMEGDKPNLVLSLGLAVASHGRQTPIRGGIPLLVNGQCVGAIGVSSGTEDQDADVARAGAAALEKT